MSASSWLVTCGIVTQLRCSAGPLIFLIRDRSFFSIGPNLAKSTCGHASRPASRAAGSGRRRRRPCAACALVCVAPASTALTKSCTSSCVIRPFGPLPLTSSSGTPSSRASLRIAGDACGKRARSARSARAPASAAVGTRRSAPAPRPEQALARRRRRGGSRPQAAERRCRSGSRARAAASTIAMRLPLATLSPTLTLSALTTPAVLDGISIDALSLSTVIRLCSTATVSPA